MMVSMAMVLERAMPFFLFSLYLITSVQICRYANWRAAGAPNPFLPRKLQPVVRNFENRLRLQIIG